MSKPTPGPWGVEYEEDLGRHTISMATALQTPGHYSAQHIIEYDHGLYPEDGKQYDEAEANARLIAAAPELLEACKKVLQDEMSDYKSCAEFGGYVLDDAVRDAVKAAIAKAEERNES